MKKILLFLLIISNFVCSSQTIENIVFEKKSHENLKLNKIELLSDKTVLYFTLTSSSENEWFNINKKSFLNDHTNKIPYDLISAENVDYSPNKTYFSKKGETKSFKLTYEKIKDNCTSIDFVDCMESGCFWISNITLKSNGEPSNNSNIALELFKNKKWNELITVCLQDKNKGLEDPTLDLLLGIAYFEKENYNQSLKYFQNYIAINKTDYTYHYNIGYCYFNLEKYDEAIDCFTKSIDYTNFLKSYYPRAVSYYRNHNIDNSLSDFEYSLKEFPEYEKDPIFLHRYGKALLEKGSSYDSRSPKQIHYTDRACEILKKSIVIFPNNDNSLTDLGLAYLNSDNFIEAKNYFEKSLKVNPNQSFINDLLAKINNNIASNKVKLKKENGIFLIPATLNNSVTVDFIFDSGASEVLVSPEIVGILLKRNTISEEDILEDGFYTIADGSTVKMKRFMMKEIKIGNKIIKNVECSVANDLYTDMLLGQSVLSKFGKYTFENNSQTLIIE